jgi:suppressor of ftsI
MNTIGLVSVMCLLALAAGCDRGSVISSGSAPPVAETFREPESIRSRDGELRATLTVAESTVQIGERSVRTTVYNGSYVPPLLRVRPGDTIRLDLVNESSITTNEHYHGMNVSPLINADGTIGDDVFVAADSGQSLQYRVPVPVTHEPGLYWYHSHRHGESERQVMGGLSGGLIVEGLLDPLPELRGIRERVLLLKDIQVDDQGELTDNIDPNAPSLRTVNGLVNPTMTGRPGETQLWRIANIGADIYYHLQLEGHAFYEIARDGNRVERIVRHDRLLLPPGSRSEVLVQAEAAGSYRLRALAFNTGPAGDSYGESTVLTFVSQGAPERPRALPTKLPEVTDLRKLPVARRRTITFDESADGNSFYVDSGNGPKQFDPSRVDATIEAGTVEEWTIDNATAELHVFHIHQTDFQVTEINGTPQAFVAHQDNVNVPYQQDPFGPPGQVKLLIDFRDPLTVGRFVYHCHILQHEDGGMMAVAQVVPRGTLGPSGAEDPVAATSMRADDPSPLRRTLNTLAGVQAGSYCRTRATPASFLSRVRFDEAARPTVPSSQRVYASDSPAERPGG